MKALTELQLNIPEIMKERLTAEGDEWNIAVQMVFNKVKHHFSNKPVFFPYYTFHGISHINVAMEFACELIPQNTLNELDGKSIFVLIAGIILHDLAMHLHAPGVKRLLFGDWKGRFSDLAQTKTWETAWNEYLLEVRRFSDEKMRYHFGMTIKAEMPDLDVDPLSQNDRLLVGEFLRRHHHILAREIQMHGFPTGRNNEHLIFDTRSETFRKMSDAWCLAGILSMSHGISIRDAEDAVYARYGNRNEMPCGVPIFYLMAVLRMADYLDAGEHRVPVVYSEEEQVPVPISASEWNWNNLINADSFHWEKERENLRIQADPKGTVDYIQLEKWLRLIQSELDMSWASIAEYYGTGKWDLSIHRILCNIHDPMVRKSYETHFLTKEARLTANPEIMKLMIAPLYGNDPTYGVRELIQNAVDACNERRDSENHSYQGTVNVRVDLSAKTLTIEDNGKGMDENVLLNYYLSAGASYRFSDDWIREHTTNKKANIIRNGRFGVGVLATFLLGDRVTVTTRHVKDALGYHFVFGIHPTQLEVKRISREPGTTIVVDLREDALSKLAGQIRYTREAAWYMWYGFAEPSVRYWFNGKEITNNISKIPQDDRPYPEWYTLPDSKYEMVRWGFPQNGFFCNGIRIPEGACIGYEGNGLKTKEPCVSVIDRNAELSLDLSRRTVLQFDDADRIKTELCKYTLAKLLMEDWSSEAAAAKCMKYGCAVLETGMDASVYLSSDKGYRVAHSTFRGSQDVIRVLQLCVDKNTDPIQILDAVKKLNPQLPCYIVQHNVHYYELSSIIESAINHRNNAMGYFTNTKAECIWTHEKYFEQLRRKVSTNTLEKVKQKRINVECGRYEIHTLSNQTFFSEKDWNSEIIPAIIAVEVEWNRDNSDIMRSMVRTYFGDDTWIPYDMDERKKKFPRAFKELKYYMEPCPVGGAPKPTEKPIVQLSQQAQPEPKRVGFFKSLLEKVFGLS